VVGDGRRKRLVPNEAEQATLERMSEMKARNATFREIGAADGPDIPGS